MRAEGLGLAAGVVAADRFWAIARVLRELIDDFVACDEVLLELVAFGAAAAEQIIKIGLDQPVDWLREAVDHPGAFTLGFDYAERLHNRELLGHFHLSRLEDLLQMADAQRAFI